VIQLYNIQLFLFLLVWQNRFGRIWS